MKVTVYNKKGGAGKTPIAMNIARELGYAIGANENNKLSRFFNESRVIEIQKKERFPKFPDTIDIVFDLGGGLDEGDVSILSAVEQSNVVLIPVFNDLYSIEKAEETYRELASINSNIIFIATKLKHKYGDLKKSDPLFDWSKTKDYQAISSGLATLLGHTPTTLIPLQESDLYAEIKMGKSLVDMAESWALQRKNIEKIVSQFNLIFKEIATYEN